jgi:hypothetical protein
VRFSCTFQLQYLFVSDYDGFDTLLGNFLYEFPVRFGIGDANVRIFRGTEGRQGTLSHLGRIQQKNHIPALVETIIAPPICQINILPFALFIYIRKMNYPTLTEMPDLMMVIFTE